MSEIKGVKGPDLKINLVSLNKTPKYQLEPYRASTSEDDTIIKVTELVPK